MKTKIYAEAGFGNKTFFSTEIEDGRKEKRIAGFILPKHRAGIYFRLWIFKKVIILSSFEGIKLQKKQKKRFKLLFGVQGTA